jgi:hypothetical protein
MPAAGPDQPLLLHRDAPQPRQRLAFLLWPGSTERQAHTNLRKGAELGRQMLRKRLSA